MPPAAAVGFASVTVQPFPVPTANSEEAGRATPLLALQKEVETVIKEISVFLRGEETAVRYQLGSDGENIRALVEALTHRLTERGEHDTGDVNMVKVHQLVARVCEYIDTAVQSCFRTACASESPTETAANDDDGPTKASESALASAPSPVKSEEIRRTDEATIQPCDQVFQDLQSKLGQLAQESESVRSRLDGLVAQNEATRAELNKLKARSAHRLARARVRNIMFTVTLEEEWLMDPVSIDANLAPCTTCLGHRIVDPPLPYSPPTLAITSPTK
jgi:hypothetical protein